MKIKIIAALFILLLFSTKARSQDFVKINLADWEGKQIEHQIPVVPSQTTRLMIDVIAKRWVKDCNGRPKFLMTVTYQGKGSVMVEFSGAGWQFFPNGAAVGTTDGFDQFPIWALPGSCNQVLVEVQHDNEE